MPRKNKAQSKKQRRKRANQQHYVPTPEELKQAIAEERKRKLENWRRPKRQPKVCKLHLD